MAKRNNYTYTPKVYLKPGDTDSFKDMRVREIPPRYVAPDPVLCPVCQGYGGWHLELDAYGPGIHFDASCTQCNGYGYVDKNSKSATCAHTFEDRTIGNCLHEWTCTKCGEKRIIDSSG